MGPLTNTRMVEEKFDFSPKIPIIPPGYLREIYCEDKLKIIFPRFLFLTKGIVSGSISFWISNMF